MSRHNAFTGVLVITATCLLASGCGSAGHKTPEDVFKTAKTAAEKDDWQGFVVCLTDDSRDQMAGAMVMTGVMMKAFGGFGGEDIKAKMKPLDDVLTKHGLTEDVIKKQGGEKPSGPPGKDALKKLAEPVKDKPAFIADMMAAMKKMGDGKKDSSPLAKDAELKDVKIEGDTAKGFVVTKEKKDPIEFRKVGGGWKIELPMDMK